MHGERRDQIRGRELRRNDVEAILASGLIIPSYLNSSIYGLVGDLSAINPDDSGVAGTSVRLARADHQHPATADVPVALTLTGTAAEGSSSFMSRADHAHPTTALPWGVVGQIFRTSNNGPFNVSTDTALVLNNVPVVSGKEYLFLFNGQCATSGAGSLWALELKVNGTIHDRMCLVQNPPAVDYNPGYCWWTAPTTQATDDFLVTATELNPGGDLTIQASATNRASLTMLDLAG